MKGNSAADLVLTNKVPDKWLILAVLCISALQDFTFFL